jgi:hypothetical protein
MSGVGIQPLHISSIASVYLLWMFIMMLHIDSFFRVISTWIENNTRLEINFLYLGSS